MKIIKPYIELENIPDGAEILRTLERIGRTCYKSEAKITETSAEKFVRGIIKSGHESVIEHVSVSVRIVCDRGVTHEIVRHRIASYSQESTRYCNYANDKFTNELTFIEPCFWKGEDGEEKLNLWKTAMQSCEDDYLKLIEMGAKPEQARSVLPNSLKTEIVCTMNLREWRHFFKLRTAREAHPQMIEVARMILDKFKEVIPVVFDDIR